MTKPGLPPLERFAPKYVVTDSCWLWTASKDHAGYGKAVHEGRLQGAHRVMYQLLVGPIPAGLHLDHLCRTPACVRPDHLEPVPPSVNRARGIDPNWQRKAKTHCVHGHPFSGTNLRIRKDGGRACRACVRAASRRAAERRRTVA